MNIATNDRVRYSVHSKERMTRKLCSKVKLRKQEFF